MNQQTYVLNNTNSLPPLSGYVTDENGNVVAIRRTFGQVPDNQTDFSLVAAEVATKFRILWIFISFSTSLTILTINSKPIGAGSAIFPSIYGNSNTTLVLPFNQMGWCETNENEDIAVTTGVGSVMGVSIGYIPIVAAP